MHLAARIPSLVALPLCSLSLLACGAAQQPAQPSGPSAPTATAEADPGFDATFQDFQTGQPVTLASLRGNVVFLDIWASWCAPCKEELPLLDDLAAKMAGQPVKIVAVTIDEDKEDAEAFLKTRPSWTLTVGHDPEGKIPEQLEPPKMPSSYVLDKTGKIRFTNEGYKRGDAEEFERQITELLAE